MAGPELVRAIEVSIPAFKFRPSLTALNKDLAPFGIVNEIENSRSYIFAPGAADESRTGFLKVSQSDIDAAAARPLDLMDVDEFGEPLYSINNAPEPSTEDLIDIAETSEYLADDEESVMEDKTIAMEPVITHEEPIVVTEAHLADELVYEPSLEELVDIEEQPVSMAEEPIVEEIAVADPMIANENVIDSEFVEFPVTEEPAPLSESVIMDEEPIVADEYDLGEPAEGDFVEAPIADRATFTPGGDAGYSPLLGDLAARNGVTRTEAEMVMYGPPKKKRGLFGR